MGARAKLVCIGSAIPVAVVFAHGCKGATQMTIDLRTNVVCTDMRGIDIVAAADSRRAEERAALVNGGPRFPSASTNDCFEGTTPRKVGTLVLTPAGSSGAVVVVSAFGTAKLDDCVAPNFGNQCIVARRRFAFIDNRQLVLPIVLDPECAGVPCNESSTCVGKKCVDSLVQCEGDNCSEPGVGADGGLVVVDGASPFIDATSPPDDASANDSGNDGAIADGGTDAGKDGSSGDGGVMRCSSANANCLQTGGTNAMVCAGVNGKQTFCCYSSLSTTCAPAGACGSDLGACCRGAEDCDPGEVCCATTATLQPGTQIYCRPQQECSNSGGRGVCTQSFQGCGSIGPCSTGGTPYSTSPQYFTCS